MIIMWLTLKSSEKMLPVTRCTIRVMMGQIGEQDMLPQRMGLPGPEQWGLITAVEQLEMVVLLILELLENLMIMEYSLAQLLTMEECTRCGTPVMMEINGKLSMQLQITEYLSLNTLK